VATAIAAFAGWNDAGSAATDAARFIADACDSQVVFSIGPEEYCDSQVNRPVIRFAADGRRELVWPSTDFLLGRLPDGSDLVSVIGVEPSFRWQAFVADVFHQLREMDVDTLWMLGALLADRPHTRPFNTQLTSTEPAFEEAFGAEKPTYEGPAGIVAVLGHEASETFGVESGALWVAVPHYVGNPPSPKAELALVKRTAEVLGLDRLDIAELADEARAWAEGVDALSSDDPDIARYVAKLEAAADAADSSHDTGEALAKELEQFLRHHGA
jgi:hypothetical protein